MTSAKTTARFCLNLFLRIAAYAVVMNLTYLSAPMMTYYENILLQVYRDFIVTFIPLVQFPLISQGTFSLPVFPFIF